MRLTSNVIFTTQKPEDPKHTGAVWASEKDPRITPVGHFLRRTRLDELPQLWNILKGEISLIGPHPERPHFITQLEKEIPFYRVRHAIKPGITGWAQVNGWRGETDTLEKMAKRIEHDIYYIEHWSLGLDLKILILTVFAPFQKNAY